MHQKCFFMVELRSKRSRKIWARWLMLLQTSRACEHDASPYRPLHDWAAFVFTLRAAFCSKHHATNIKCINDRLLSSACLLAICYCNNFHSRSCLEAIMLDWVLTKFLGKNEQKRMTLRSEKCDWKITQKSAEISFLQFIKHDEKASSRRLHQRTSFPDYSRSRAVNIESRKA